MICKHIFQRTFLNEPELFLCTQVNGFKHRYITVTIEYQSFFAHIVYW